MVHRSPTDVKDPGRAASTTAADCAKTLQRLADVVCVFNEAGVFLFVSPSCMDLFGYSAEEMTGRHFSTFIHPEDLPQSEEEFKHLLSSPAYKTSNFENRYLKKEGAVVPVIWSARWHEADRLLYCVARDGTEKAQLQHRLDRAQKLARVGNYAFDLVNKRFTYWSESLSEILGIHKNSLDTFTTEHALNMIHPEDRETVIQTALQSLQAAAQHPVSRLECRLIRPDGETVHLSIFREVIVNHVDVPVSMTGTIVDITERKIQERIIKQNQEVFRCLVQDGSDLITIIDENRHFLFVSDNVTNILGYTPAELIGRKSGELLHEDDVPLAATEHQKVLSNQLMPSRIQHRFRHKNGTWVWLEGLGTNHLNNPYIQGVLVVSRTINDRVTLQDQLNQALLSKQREIAAAMIRAQEKERTQLGRELHDNVNQILTTIKLYNELAIASEVPDKTLLAKAVQFTQNCIDEIRSISKQLSAPALEHFSLRASLEELVASINVAKRVKVRCSIEDLKPGVVSEELYLTIYRIVQEGLINILKSSHAQEASIKLTTHDGRLWLTIKDNGVGFDLEAKHEGIGLTNMKTRAEHMNASFSIDTAPGKGCTIEISFPIG